MHWGVALRTANCVQASCEAHLSSFITWSYNFLPWLLLLFVCLFVLFLHLVFSLRISTSHKCSMFSHIEHCLFNAPRCLCVILNNWIFRSMIELPLNIDFTLCLTFYYTHPAILGWHFTLTLVFSWAKGEWKYLCVFVKYFRTLYTDSCNKYYI